MSAIRVIRQDGQPYTLAADAIRNWDQTDNPVLLRIVMQRSSIVAMGTVADMDRAYGLAMSSPARRR